MDFNFDVTFADIDNLLQLPTSTTCMTPMTTATGATTAQVTGPMAAPVPTFAAPTTAGLQRQQLQLPLSPPDSDATASTTTTQHLHVASLSSAASSSSFEEPHSPCSDHSGSEHDSEWDKALFEMSRKDFVRYCAQHKDELGEDALAKLRKARRRYKNRGYQQAARTRHSIEHAADKQQSHAKLQAHATRLTKHCHLLEQQRDEAVRLLRMFCPQQVHALSFAASLK